MMRKDRRAGPRGWLWDLGRVQACSTGPPNPAVCPQGRGPKPGSCMAPFLTPRKLVLAVVIAASLDSGTPGGDSSGPAGSPLREGTAGGERGIQAIGLSEMTDANIVWPLVRGSHIMCWACVVSLSCFQHNTWASQPTIQTGHRGAGLVPREARLLSTGLGFGPGFGPGCGACDPAHTRPVVPARLWGGCCCLCPARRLSLRARVWGQALTPGLPPEPSDPEPGSPCFLLPFLWLLLLEGGTQP